MTVRRIIRGKMSKAKFRLIESKSNTVILISLALYNKDCLKFSSLSDFGI